MAALMLTLALFLLGPGSGTTIEVHNDTFVKRIGPAEFPSVIAQHHMVAIYFSSEVDIRVSTFLDALEKAAEDLLKCDVVVGLNDCTNKAIAMAEFCSIPDVHESLYVFRNGQFLINVNLRALFDMSAIISNLLTIRLLNEVRVAQTSDDRLRAEQNASGKCIVHGLFMSIGISEHAAFMRVAYGHKDDVRLRFIFGTRPDSVQELGHRLGLDDERLNARKAERATVIVTCYEADTTTPVTSHIYSGSMDYEAFSSFISALGEPDVVDLSTNPGMTEYTVALAGRRHVLVAVYDHTVRSIVDEVVQRLAAKFYKIFIALLIDKKGIEHVAKYVQLTAADLTMVPIYCLASREKPQCDTIIVAKDIDAAVHRLSIIIAACARPETGQPEAINKNEGLLLSRGIDPELELINAVETQDDQVAIRASVLHSSPTGLPDVPALTRDTFSDCIQRASGLLVLFHLQKLDPSSIMALHVLAEAKEQLRDSRLGRTFATVDCFDWTDVCANASVHEYPMLRIYRQGRASQPLTVPVSVQGFVTAGKLASVANPVYLQTSEEVDRFVTASVLLRKEDVQTSAAFSEHSLIVIGVFGSSNETADVAGFLHLSAQHEGTAVFGVAFGTVAEQLLARHGAGHRTVPAVIAFNVYKGELVTRAARIYSGNMSDVKALEKFFVSASLPVLVELTPATLPALRTRALPIVLLFTESDSSGEIALMENVAQWPVLDRALSFAFMPRHSYGAQTILSEYWPQRTILPALVVVDFSQGAVHRYEDEATAEGSRKEAIADWLSSVLAGTSSPQSRLGAKSWPPAHPGYDFLALAEHGQSLFQHDRLTRPHQQQQQQMTTVVADAAAVGAAGYSDSSRATQLPAMVTATIGSQPPSPGPDVQHTEL